MGRSRANPKKTGRRPKRGNGSAMIVSPARGALTPQYGPVVRMQRSHEFQLAAPATEQPTLWNFSLSDLPSFSEFQNLFLQWKLDRVTVDITWNSPTGATSGTPPRMLYCADPMAVAADFTGPNTLLQRKCRVWVPNPTKNTCRISFKPAVIMLVTNEPGSAAIAQAPAPGGLWYSTSTPQVSYGTLVAWHENYTTANAGAGAFTHYHTFHLSFRGAK